VPKLPVTGRPIPLMTYQFFICDVFTKHAFQGNQLAVFPKASGLKDEQMQQIAHEFNFSETTFVFPPEQGQTKRVRIFTPTSEIPFAGHPNLGTAFTLYRNGYLGEVQPPLKVVFEEDAGLVPVTITNPDDGHPFFELQAPTPLSLGAEIRLESVSQALNLPGSAIRLDRHRPQLASVGMPFLMVELKDREALEKARPNLDAFQVLQAQGVSMMHLYVHSEDEFDLRTRMFAPFDGMTEDPATGSANCALAGLLVHLEEGLDRDYDWRIAQGVEMGRPSELRARARKQNGVVTTTWIGGNCIQIAEGNLHI
jgi:trans-2,3-dihydro-3-hydroxyanthranilate isomerase